MDILRQTDCMVVNQVTVHNFAFLFNCTTVGRPETKWRLFLHSVSDGWHLTINTAIESFALLGDLKKMKTNRDVDGQK